MNSPIISTSKHGKVPVKKRELSNSSDSSSSNDNEKINQHKRKKSKILVKQKKRRNTSKHKYKKGKSRSSSSDSSTSEDSSTSSSSDSSSISSSSEEEKRRRKKKQKLKKSTDKTEKSSISLPEKKSIDEGPSNDIPLALMDQRKSLAPMTKEEWEKRQSVVRRVYDETTGRHRLIKGDGEVIEEIVSKERHKQINKQATKGDGEYFQSQLKKM